MTMRVLHCEHQRSWTGQTGRVLDDIRQLRTTGVEVRLICRPDSRLAERAAGSGFDPIPVRLESNYAAVQALSRHIRDFKPDIVHAHSSRIHLCSLLAAGPNGTVVVRTKHNLNGLRSGIFSRLMYGHFTDRLIAVSEAVKAGMVRDGIAPDRVSVVRGGVDLGRFTVRDRKPGDRAKLNLAEDGILMGMVSRLVVSKGVEILFKAIPRIVAEQPDVRFVLVGAGEFWRQYLAEKALEPVCRSVTIVGFVDDVRPYLTVMNAVIVPSLTEGLSSTILEAMASGKPTIAANVGGIPELVVPGETGELFAVGDPAGLADAVLAFARRPERWPTYGEQARLRATRFDLRRLGPATLEVYEEALRKSSSS